MLPSVGYKGMRPYLFTSEKNQMIAWGERVNSLCIKLPLFREPELPRISFATWRGVRSRLPGDEVEQRNHWVRTMKRCDGRWWDEMVVFSMDGLLSLDSGTLATDPQQRRGSSFSSFYLLPRSILPIPAPCQHNSENCQLQLFTTWVNPWVDVRLPMGVADLKERRTNLIDLLDGLVT